MNTMLTNAFKAVKYFSLSNWETEDALYAYNQLKIFPKYNFIDIYFRSLDNKCHLDKFVCMITTVTPFRKSLNRT